LAARQQSKIISDLLAEQPPIGQAGQPRARPYGNLSFASPAFSNIPMPGFTRRLAWLLQ
jgi:hypothetical protein